jgi:diacylglycerol O-acyltransferase
VPERLTPLDGSFLRVETPNAHMHVAWTATFRVPDGAPAPTLRALREAVASRLRRTPRFRRRLAFPPQGMGEPFWVDDHEFDITRHVVPLGRVRETIDDARFAELCDEALSEPLNRRQPLWRIYLAPRLEGGRCGIIAKLHHALVDGKSAVEVALLLFDATPEIIAPQPSDWRPAAPPSRTRLAMDALAGGAGESLRAARGMARMAGSPIAGGARVTGTLRRAAMSVGEDLLRPAPSSFLNVPIGPRRTLVRHRAPMDELRSVKESAGVTLNDVCLAVVAGAMRELAITRGQEPRPLKAMVPVSMRTDPERDTLGNRISLVFVELPVELRSPRARLERIHAATDSFKRNGRHAGAQAVYGALGLLPDMLRTPAARAVGSARVYNLTVSNIPGPDLPIYMLGSELIEAHPVVPIAERHALSVGIFSYRDRAHFGLYADPDALPEVDELPAALSESLAALG